jgi:two-component system sensor histidine kinase PilS (NtrC family)
VITSTKPVHARIMNQALNRSPYASQWDPLKVYSSYRVLLSILLFGIFFINLKNPQIGTHNSVLYLFTAISYIVVSIGTLITLFFKSQISKLMTFGIVCSDILFITGLAHASGGISSHISILLVVSVAAGGILISGRVATLIAAVASMAILYEHFYFLLTQNKDDTAGSLQAALLGVAFFATSSLAQMIANRLRTSEALMAQAKRELAELENLNYHIIQRMRTGIVVINHEMKILSMNASARRLLGIDQATPLNRLSDLCPQLCAKVKQWQQHNNAYHQPFKSQPASPEISANLADLAPTGNILIFLDDISRMAQQAQQLKLASLGQLTAAIAHEIRNPLGAISHAAQLLAESNTIAQADTRLTQIIEDQSKRVNQIIENVLELSRRKPATHELLSMHAWLPKFLHDFPAGCLTLQLPDQDLNMRFDPSQLAQVLHNLLENALRYSPKHNDPITGAPCARVLIQGGEDRLTELPYLEIIDNGPGVADAQVQHLFEPFFTTETKGTGLGLYICRELCQANYANLDYVPLAERQSAQPTSVDFTGACFRITFAHPNKLMTNS